MATIISHSPVITANQFNEEENPIEYEYYNTSNTLTNISKEAFNIAQYYIAYNLRQSIDHEKLRGLPKNYLIPPSEPSSLYLTISYHCNKLESDYGEFFKDVPNRLSLDGNNAQILFSQICKDIFSEGVINWGRILTIFALSATFAQYFVKKGLVNIIPNIPKWVQKAFDGILVNWIADQGGWNDLPKKLCHKIDIPAWSRALAYGGVVAAAAYLLFSNGVK